MQRLEIEYHDNITQKKASKTSVIVFINVSVLNVQSQAKTSWKFSTRNVILCCRVTKFRRDANVITIIILVAFSRQSCTEFAFLNQGLRKNMGNLLHLFLIENPKKHCL